MRLAERARALRSEHPEMLVEDAQHAVREADPALDRAYADWRRNPSRPAGSPAVITGGRFADPGESEIERLKRVATGGRLAGGKGRLVTSEQLTGRERGRVAGLMKHEGITGTEARKRVLAERGV
jgi:hypothetical protein